MKNVLFTLALASWLAGGAAAQKTSRENEVRDRGQTRAADETQTLNRGRLGRQAAIPSQPLTLHGTLIDAGCVDRSASNLTRPPHAPALAQAENKSNSGGVSAQGITVDAKTTQAVRSDVEDHLVPDLRNRVADPACAVTGNTRNFAMLMDTGRLLNLDEGGNTLAMANLQATAPGRAMLSGTGPAIKPKATVKGIIHGDTLNVLQIVKME